MIEVVKFKTIISNTKKLFSKLFKSSNPKHLKTSVLNSNKTFVLKINLVAKGCSYHQKTKPSAKTSILAKIKIINFYKKLLVLVFVQSG